MNNNLDILGFGPTPGIELRLEWDAALLGAGRGDRIGVQLLLCNEGIYEVSGRKELERLRIVRSAGPAVRMTREIEFTAP